jgi:hypothetical protein
VKKGILVRKFNVCSGANNDHVGGKSFVLLHHDHFGHQQRGLRRRFWREPYHDIVIAGALFRAVHDFDFASQGGFLSEPIGGSKNSEQRQLE